MVGQKRLLGMLLTTGCAYGLYPYVALYELGQAVRQGDAVKLGTMVDWASVREGIKEDICDHVVEQPEPAQASGQLPPFGAGFVRGIATNTVDKRVTPEALVAAAQQPDPKLMDKGDGIRVSWAFFVSPSAFMVDLGTSDNAPIRLQMDLRDGAWHVTRVWLPPEMLGGAGAGT
ncbi:MAG: DUF2939 domain-containing protein [Acetobacteraceae bacterium]|jgi:Protein of unknown function (DUF2939)